MATTSANCPGGCAAPEELRCHHASKGFSQNYGYRYFGTNPKVAHMVGDPFYYKLVTTIRQFIHYCGGLVPVPLLTLPVVVIGHAKQRSISNGSCSFSMW